MNFVFEDVSLLITVYNRSNSLERLLFAFSDLSIVFGEVVVSDDGSNEEHLGNLKRLQDRFNFVLITATKNAGLGNNINKGQDAVTKPFTLYIQEDFVPSSKFGEYFSKSLEVMKIDKSLDIIRFYGYFRYPYTKPYNSYLSELVYKPALVYANHLKFYMYSDHPHLRRSDFFSKFGKYKEGVIGDLTELYMSYSFIKNNGRALLMNDLTSMIDQKNSSTEPTTMERKDWKTANTLLIKILRTFYIKYRLIKNTVELKVFKSNHN